MPTPAFSIVIPTYNRPAQLRTCLAALRRLTYPRERFEVVVVDDGGAAALEPVVEPFREALDLRLLRRPNGGPAAARNTGAARATGAYLAFTDDDCAPEPGWLDALARRVQERPGALVGGRTVNALDANPFAAASQALITYLYGYYNADPDRARFFASNNMAVPADAFRALGGFDTATLQDTAEDRELCDRWADGGRPLVYAPGAVVRHAHAMGLRGFWRQHFSYGRGAVYFHRLRQQRGQPPMEPEPLAFYLGLLRHPFRAATSRRRALQVSALMAVSQVANALGFFYEAATARPPAAPKRP